MYRLQLTCYSFVPSHTLVSTVASRGDGTESGWGVRGGSGEMVGLG